ncbi:hypothetical protein Misp01_02780 [Microtetraspora sp. NBRC 13810]|uniref:hypothetical protein n=1 Tax=Microtetraspora sp. NBRC 13810 TaxID=3030990 RepID=UPI0024A07F6D|nr:hypothetical protein [Microtetraspora sp. NBRC 13810]GLW05148.1 hypothetical protein Misp01_02780 [Microtetraspora sp. NBRC 13810]
MQLTFPVPRETSSVFVVAVDRITADPVSVVPWRMHRPHRRAAAASLGSSRLRISVRRAVSPWRWTGHRRRWSWPAPWRDFDTRRWRGFDTRPWRSFEAGSWRGFEAGSWRGFDAGGWEAGDDERALVRRARLHIVVSSVAPPSAQPEAAQTARAAARALAAANDGVIVDPLTGAIVFHCACCPGERPHFSLPDDWLTHHPTTSHRHPPPSETHAPSLSGLGSLVSGRRPAFVTPRPAADPRRRISAVLAAAGARPADPSGRAPAGLSPVVRGGSQEAAGRLSPAPDASAASPGVLAPPVVRAVAPGMSVPSLVSRGLVRFGLPEVAVTEAGCAHGLCSVTRLRAVAGRLLADHLAFLHRHPGAGKRTLDTRLHLATTHDLDALHNAALPGSDALRGSDAFQSLDALEGLGDDHDLGAVHDLGGVYELAWGDPFRGARTLHAHPVAVPAGRSCLKVDHSRRSGLRDTA